MTSAKVPFPIQRFLPIELASQYAWYKHRQRSTVEEPAALYFANRRLQRAVMITSFSLPSITEYDDYLASLPRSGSVNAKQPTFRLTGFKLVKQFRKIISTNIHQGVGIDVFWLFGTAGGAFYRKKVNFFTDYEVDM